MLEKDSWLPQAKELERGQTTYVEHDCGSGRKLLVSHDDRGYNAWCFRCSDGGYEPLPRPSLGELLERVRSRNASDRVYSNDTRLPLPKVPNPDDWPLEASAWLYVAGIHKDTIRDIGIYYHPPTERVVIPVFGAGEEPIFWQARGFSDCGPKYLSPSVDKSKVIATFGSDPQYGIVIVEDLLSAIRIGEVGKSLCLLGTHLSDSTASYLSRLHLPVRLWLDPDGPGQKAAHKIMKTLSLFSLRVDNIVSTKDPKLYTCKEIRQFLST